MQKQGISGRPDNPWVDLNQINPKQAISGKNQLNPGRPAGRPDKLLGRPRRFWVNPKEPFLAVFCPLELRRTSRWEWFSWFLGSSINTQGLSTPKVTHLT